MYQYAIMHGCSEMKSSGSNVSGSYGIKSARWVNVGLPAFCAASTSLILGPCFFGTRLFLRRHTRLCLFASVNLCDFTSQICVWDFTRSRIRIFITCQSLALRVAVDVGKLFSCVYFNKDTPNSLVRTVCIMLHQNSR